jgi:hypothetical protein
MGPPTVSETVADAFEKQKALPKEGSLVVLTEVAGAGFEPATLRVRRSKLRQVAPDEVP